MTGGQKAFMELRREFTDARDAKFVQLLRSRVENQPSDSLDGHRQDRAGGNRIFLSGYRAIHALGAPVFSGVCHCGSHCRLAAADWISLLFLHAIARRAFRCHVSDRAALARGDLPRGHRDCRSSAKRCSCRSPTGGIVQTAQNIDRRPKLAAVPVHHGLRNDHHRFLLPVRAICRGRDHEGTERHDGCVAGGRSRLAASRRIGGWRGTHRGGCRRHAWAARPPSRRPWPEHRPRREAQARRAESPATCPVPWRA